jgi:hypothetical protein
MSDSGEQPWPIEKEGELVRLLRRFAEAEDAGETEDVRRKLRDATGEEIAGGLNKWLAWYLEDHLGIRPVLEVLTGHEPAPAGDGEPSERRDEPVFMRPEYNWCALERVRNRDDMTKLRHVYTDLETPLSVHEDGPFSFRRLTGLSAEELAYFHNRSLSDALFDAEVQLTHLRLLKDYGKLMMMPVLPNPTQRAGAILYAASIAQALVRFQTKISSLSYQHLAESLRNLVDRPYVVERYATLFRTALEKYT